jgi:anti-anti-sigma regulatory factor
MRHSATVLVSERSAPAAAEAWRRRGLMSAEACAGHVRLDDAVIGPSLLTLFGEWDVANVEVLERYALAAAERDGDLIVDLTDAPFLDLHILERLLEALSARRRALRTKGPSRCVTRLLILAATPALQRCAEPDTRKAWRR